MIDPLLEGELRLRQLADRYADSLNRDDFEAFADCWTLDGIWVTPPPFNISQRGRDNIKNHLVDRRRSVAVVVMTVGAVVAETASETRVTGRTTIEEQGSRDEARGVHVLGLYDDEIVNEDGRWFFASRRLTLLAVDNSPSEFVKEPQGL
jgi:hypothetical protein